MPSALPVLPQPLCCSQQVNFVVAAEGERTDLDPSSGIARPAEELWLNGVPAPVLFGDFVVTRFCERVCKGLNGFEGLETPVSSGSGVGEALASVAADAARRRRAANALTALTAAISSH